ncbi:MULTISPECIES: hypothetical protein [unclassified Bradyrhizobium]|uniref:hypothetical protein n=1 Tax=unclassified Bradyrhizobium TaxID=2631580 RepID=UPI001FFBCE06|nr:MULTISPECIES: hypothetical protein [unclassified Bradyrhizobium]MCK1676361.1 hypothetical protein [Bradyrhizobium sp. 150]MCK1686619.1 hypothetical protein [Bradyrhizobium sp. 145]
MPVAKPFHRNFRGIADGPNSGYSSLAYILDRDYARDAEHYVRALTLIQDDLRSIFEYVEPSAECMSAYSFRIHSLFMRTCIEIEANFKVILAENNCSRSGRQLNMVDYRRVDATHHLSSYEVMLPIWSGSPPTLRPFEQWRPLRGLPSPHGKGVPISWYQDYNTSKHDRHDAFKKANLKNLILSVAGLLVIVTSQFGAHDFGAGTPAIVWSNGYQPMRASIGELFRVNYPTDWAEDEIYDFNWSDIKDQPNRFGRIDFDAIPA